MKPGDEIIYTPMGTMKIAGSNGFGHGIEFMSQAYLRNRYSEIDIRDESSISTSDRPLPVFLKVFLRDLNF